MSRKLLVRYIREAVAETKLARVPNQLLAPDDKEESGKIDDEAVESVNEFSGCGVGSIAGYSGPLGVDPDELGRKKNSRRK